MVKTNYSAPGMISATPQPEGLVLVFATTAVVAATGVIGIVGVWAWVYDAQPPVD